MSVVVEDLGKNMAKMTVTVSADKLEQAINKAYNKQKGSISLPGFRKGKVPRYLVEKTYGVEVFYEDAANILLQQEYHCFVQIQVLMMQCVSTNLLLKHHLFYRY